MALALGLLAAPNVVQAQTLTVDGYRVTVASPGAHQAALTTANSQAQDGSRVGLWRYWASSGDCLTITLTSTDFRPYLQISQGTPNRRFVASASAASGDATAVATFTAPADNYYFIHATSVGPGDRRGQYALNIGACEGAFVPARAPGARDAAYGHTSRGA